MWWWGNSSFVRLGKGDSHPEGYEGKGGAMARVVKIYTKRGDKGETSLGGGQRVRKDTLRVQVYGTVDELNSQIGVALAIGLCKKLTQALAAIQNELFDLGSDLCFVEADKAKYS